MLGKAMNPTGGAKKKSARRKDKLSSGSDALTGYGPLVLGNRPVRTRMPGGVGAGGEKPPATRFDDLLRIKMLQQLY